MRKNFGLSAIALLAFSNSVIAQTPGSPGFLPPSAPIVPAISPSDLFNDIPLGYPTAGNQYVTATQLGTYPGTLSGGNSENALIGADFTTNLFQNGTSVVLASPAAVAYSAADEWFVWGGTNTPITSSQQTGATDIPSGYGATLRINKASGAGVVQVCVGQEIRTANAIRFQGQTVEFDLGHIKAGPTFSAANSTLAAYVLTGTGTNEGSANAAFSINGGGGSSTPWTGATLLGGTAGFQVPITTAFGRYIVAAPIAAGVTEIALAICDTPVGTGTAGDWFEFSGSQFVPNSALTTVAGAAGAVLPVNDPRAKAFLRRPTALERDLQLADLSVITESKTAVNIRAACTMSTSSIANCLINFPIQMNAVPTMTYTAGFEASATTASTSATVCTALTTSTTLTGNAATQNGVLVDCASSAGFGAAGTGSFLWDIGTSSGTGIIKASAQL